MDTGPENDIKDSKCDEIEEKKTTESKEVISQSENHTRADSFSFSSSSIDFIFAITKMYI